MPKRFTRVDIRRGREKKSQRNPAAAVLKMPPFGAVRLPHARAHTHNLGDAHGDFSPGPAQINRTIIHGASTQGKPDKPDTHLCTDILASQRSYRTHTKYYALLISRTRLAHTGPPPSAEQNHLRPPSPPSLEMPKDCCRAVTSTEGAK